VSSPAPTTTPRATDGTVPGSSDRRLGPDIHAIVRACREEGRVRTVFQPIVDLTTGAICGFEALARFPMWQPHEWFRAAADADMSGWLETTILRAAFAAMREIPDGCFMSVNMSPGALTSVEAQRELADHVDLRQVVIEITGRLSPGQATPLAEALQLARTRGARVALDESGRGGTGLITFATLAPDLLKLERSLVSGVDGSDQLAKGAAAAVALARHFGAEVVAQGIETEAELEAVIGLGIPYGQGFAFGHALPTLKVRRHRHEETIRRLTGSA
jgi:EAL domain-containing protein (putative c-di-GMP-specific phosphodiesterase class I)